ncbi:hypothetical protein ACFVVL_34800 [Kitasatospora sp. NPDC058115]|uniref:hypothetical protein n=1 Tax=Kitasatospora sp. NPDC058115 TaxID=3346347 RepID=UPI0036DB06F6
MDESVDRAQAEAALEGPGAARIRAKRLLGLADDDLRPLVSAAVKAGVPLRRIAALTGLTTNTVMLWGKREDG